MAPSEPDATRTEQAGGPAAPAPWFPAVYGLIHAVVDAACVTAVFRALGEHAVVGWAAFYLVLGYDLLAFATQLPLGMLADRLRAPRAAAAAGIVLTALAVPALRIDALTTMVLAGVGNALFHLGAGAFVVGSSIGRATPAGIFVAPGALGLGLGLWMGRTGNGPTWPFLVLLAAGLAFTLLARPPALRFGEPSPFRREAGRAGRGELAVWIAVSLLMLSTVVRSFVGFGGPYRCPKGTLMLAGLPLAAFAGKLIGGPLADRLGWIATSVAALLLSAPLIAFAGGEPSAILPGMFLFQATMPVTLAAVAAVMPGRPATAFGLPCLALILGAIPTFYPWGRAWYGAAPFLVAILISAAALFVGLWLLRDAGIPIRGRRRGG
jgi:FSR family fosmidomycin resistance protein-like MFS transporter